MNSSTPARIVHPMGRLHLLLWVFGSLATFALLWTVSAHVNPGNSDGATVILEGQSLAHGNLLLHGWTLSSDSFWTVDVLFYSIAVLIVGVHSYLLHAIPALIATLIILLACRLVALDTSDRALHIARWFIVACLVFPSAIWTQFYLAGPYHVGTVLWSLGAFYLCYSTPSLWRYVLASLFIAAGILGDLQMITLGVIPMALAGFITMLRSWSLRQGASQIIVGAAGSLLALIVRKIANLLGTFTLAPAHPAAGWSQLFHNLTPAGRYGANLFGLGTGTFGFAAPSWPVQVGHILELVLVVGAILVALAQLLKGLVSESSGGVASTPTWRLNDLLLLGLLADIATFAYLATTGSNTEARYLSAGVIYGVILAARYVGQFTARIAGTLQVRLVGLVGLVATAFVVLGGIDNAISTPVAQPIAQLDLLLKNHHLTQGIGGYWTASITTVETNGAINVRPVVTGPDGTLVRYQRQSDAAWYKGQRFQFLVYNADVAVDDITRSAARVTFGKAEHVYAFENYRVLVYKDPITISVHGFTT